MKATTLVTLLLAALTALHAWTPFVEERSTLAAFGDVENAQGTFVANVPIAGACAVWAEAPDGEAATVVGRANVFDGCVRSNGGISVRGHDHVFNGTLRHVAEFRATPQSHDARRGHVLVESAAYPWSFPVERYAPGGRAAEEAREQGRYFVHSGRVRLEPPLLVDGLHYVDGDATIVGPFEGRATIVATGRVQFHVRDVAMAAWTDGLLVHVERARENGSGAAELALVGPGGSLAGTLHAIRGDVRVTTEDLRLEGQLAGATVHVGGEGNGFVARSPLGAPSEAPPSIRSSPASSAKPPSPPPAHLAGAAGFVPVGVSFGDFDGDGVPETRPTFEPASANPLLNNEFTVGGVRTLRPAEKPVRAVAYDSVGSVIPGSTEPDGHEPAPGWAYRPLVRGQALFGDATWFAQGTMTFRVDPRDSGLHAATLTQAMGQRPFVGLWRDPEAVRLTVLGTVDPPVRVRALYAAVEDPFVLRATDVGVVDTRGPTELVLHFPPEARGTMTEFMLVVESDRTAFFALDRVELLGAVFEPADGFPRPATAPNAWSGLLAEGALLA